MDNFKKLAKNLVKYSCKIKKGEKVLIEQKEIDPEFIVCLIKEIQKARAYPFVVNYDEIISRQLMLGTDEIYAKLKTKYMLPVMQDMDAYIGLMGSNNIFELSDVPANQKSINNKFYQKPVHFQERVNNTKWVLLRWPNMSMAQNAGMSTDAFEEIFFNVCTLNYRKMDKAMDNLVALMQKTDKVEIISPNTHLTFSIKGQPAIKCLGQSNIPDGEVFTGPIKHSLNGMIAYNIPTLYDGNRFDNVSFSIKDGKIINATSYNNTEKLNQILDIDEGARYFGEFAIGVNPYITRPILDILFDEKMCGSFHLTPGGCYDEAFNDNKSAIHWDMVLCQLPKYGGGEIYFDDILIRKDGKFVISELETLNPENLM